MHPCPCCGFATLAEPLGSHEICGRCGWEDDEVQQRWPAYRGGANRASLCEAQAEFLRRAGANAPVMPEVRRHPGWRPLRPHECVDAGADPAREPYVYYWDRDPAA